MGPCEEKLLVLLREVNMWSDSPEKHEVIAFIETRLANIESYKGNYNKAFAYISEALNYAKHAGGVEIGRAYIVMDAIYHNMRELGEAYESLMKAHKVLRRDDTEPYLSGLHLEHATRVRVFSSEKGIERR